MGNLKKKDPEVYRAILEETRRENDNLELIASENFVSEAVLAAQGLGGKLWVVKAQIHAGGRGKGGGVKLAKSLDEVEALAKTMIGMTLPSAFNNPVAVSMGVTACAIACWLRGRMRHLSEPSFQPALTILATEASESTDCTPGTARMCHSNWSMSATTSWSTQPLGTVSTITEMMSTPMLNLVVMIRVSWL